jgi:hypothetical protein
MYEPSQGRPLLREMRIASGSEGATYCGCASFDRCLLYATSRQAGFATLVGGNMNRHTGWAFAGPCLPVYHNITLASDHAKEWFACLTNKGYAGSGST